MFDCVSGYLLYTGKAAKSIDITVNHVTALHLY